MAILSNKSVKISLLLIFLLNVILRYPSSNHSRGSDSFDNISVAGYISENGTLGSFMNPLSYFGLYPESRNMGGAFLLSGFSETINVNIESSIFILNFSLILLSLLGTFLFSKQIFSENSTSLIATFLLTTSRKMFYFTAWTYSYRGPFLCLLPVALFWIFYTRRGQSLPYYRYSIILVFLLLSLISIHRLGYFFIFFVPMIGIIKIFFLYFGINLRKVIVKARNRDIIGFSLLTIMLILLIFLNSTSFYSIKYGEVAPSYIMDKVSIFASLVYPVAFVFGYSKITGLLFPFAFFGVWFVYRVPLHSANITSLAVTSFLFLFFWFDLSYASMFFLPFLLLFNAKGISITFNYFSSFFGRFSTSFVLVFILLFSQLLVPSIVSIPLDSDSTTSIAVHELPKDELITYSYDAGNYLKYHSRNPILYSGTVSISKTSAFCGCPNKEFMYGASSEGNIRQGELSDLLDATSRSIFELIFVPSRDFKYHVLLGNKTWLDPTVEQIIEYEFGGNRTYNYLSTPGLEEYMVYDGELKKVRFTLDLSSQRYKIFDNGAVSNIYFSY